MTLFKKIVPGLELSTDTLRDRLGVIHVSDLPQRTETGLPPAPAELTLLQERWWQYACVDLQANVVEGRYFGAGREFGPTVFTRDIALSAVLSLNHLHPALVWQSLQFDRELRFRVGWKVIRSSSAAEISSLPFEQTPCDFREFVATFRTGDFSRRTDDVVWLWAARDWLERNPALANEACWRWVYETGLRCFDEFYDRFHDPFDGLYRGQACFVDIMMCGYPSEIGDPVPGDAADFLVRHVDDPRDTSRWRFGRRPASLRASIMGKAASTNALYVLGLNALADCADRLGRNGESARWRRRASELAASVRREFLMPDGGLAYHKAETGSLNRRSHPLGAAFCVLAGILKGAEAARVLASVPATWRGIPLYAPFYADNPHVYHNRSAWPFADAFVHLAQMTVQPAVETRERWLALNGRACRNERGFRELVDFESGRLIGSDHQLWSAAAYCGAALAKA